MPSLEVSSLEVDYGNGAVLSDVSLTAERGRVLAIVGPNGAGKTSLLWSVSGFAPGRGSVRLHGTEILGRAPDTIARSGLALVPDDRGLFPPMSIDDHLWLAAHGRPTKSELSEILALFPQLADRRRQSAGSLSGGEAQMLAVAMAVLRRPEVLLIDELSFGLAPQVVSVLLEVCRQLAQDRNIAVVLVEQFVDLVAKVADDAIVLTDGHIVRAGSARDVLLDRDDLNDAYLGS